MLRLRGGGKVHGSLARAGKVKGQTPKVEKQEKRKTPRGRAKKRILYSRRFLNVATGVGGKRLGVRSGSGRPRCVHMCVLPGWCVTGLALFDGRALLTPGQYSAYTLQPNSNADKAK